MMRFVTLVFAWLDLPLLLFILRRVGKNTA